MTPSSTVAGRRNEALRRLVRVNERNRWAADILRRQRGDFYADPAAASRYWHHEHMTRAEERKAIRKRELRKAEWLSLANEVERTGRLMLALATYLYDTAGIAGQEEENTTP